MKPIEPCLSFAAQKYLNATEVHLSRMIAHIGRHDEINPDAQQFYESFAKALSKFQHDVPVEFRSVLRVLRDGPGEYRLVSTYRSSATKAPTVLATVQFDPVAPPALARSSCLNATHRLRDALAARPHLSLTCLLQPLQSLIDTLFGAGWKNTVSLDTQNYLLIALGKEGGVTGSCVTIAVEFDNFEAETKAIREFHESKDKPDGNH